MGHLEKQKPAKMGFFKPQHLSAEWEQMTCIWTWAERPSCSAELGPEQQLLYTGTASLGSCPGSAPGPGNLPAESPAFQVQNLCPAPSICLMGTSVFRNSSNLPEFSG
jgi:hypothetical protein